MKRKLIFVFISFFLLLIPFTVKASIDGYTIERYGVDIVVNENNVLDVTETITVVYDNPYKHGIIREIPLTSNYHTKVNGKDVTIKQKAKITNVFCSYEHTTTKEDGYLNIKIGKASEYAEVDKEYMYMIKYSYDTGDDNIDEYDELYFNIIGHNWTADIKEAYFTIHMPKEFKAEDENGKLINFTTGYYGNAYNRGVSYSIDGTKIIGSVDKLAEGVALHSREGLTVKLELPKDYFVGERKFVDKTRYYVCFGILYAFLSLIFGTRLFIKHGLRRKKISVVTYSAPNGMDPALAGYVYEGYSRADHIVSLITYLATKGYLKIIDDKGSKFKLQFLKPLDANEPDYIQTTFKGLFKKADEEGIVTKSQLTNKFYTSLNTAVSQLHKKRKIFDKKRDLVKTFCFFSILISFVVFAIMCFSSSYRLQTTYKPHFIVATILLVINFITMIVFSSMSNKRTEESEEEYAEVAGFREFIDKVEVDKIETLVEETPDLFYKILPYAYVFNLTNKWIKKFESIKLSPPDWYEGNIYDINTGAFNFSKFTSDLNSVTASTRTTMSSRPYESYGGSGGGGGFSGGGGGGFSGGGGGGGGGHSW